MLVFWDFEVFKYDWLVVMIDPVKKQETVIVNNPYELEQYMKSHKNHIFCGYNSKSYDNYICKAILAGYNPFDMNEWIIREDKPGWAFDDSLRDYNFNSYDVYSELMPSLKKLEGFMGLNIYESKIDFRLDRKLTEDEIEETIRYCRSDVNALITVFCKREENNKDFLSKFTLVEMYNLPLSSLIRTKAQITSDILGAVRHDYDDEWDLQFPDNLEISKYKEVIDWFHNPENQREGAELKCEVAGMPTVFAWGGVHGALNNYFDEGEFVDADVASLYPSIMLQYNLLSRSIPDSGKEEYAEIKSKRLEYKHSGQKEMANALKICLNALYGVSNFKGSPVYDPRQAHSVCLTGQLLLLDLVEHIEDCVKIIQLNTDGIYVKFLSEEGKTHFYEECHKWEKRARLDLEYDKFVKIAQRDVNNYIVCAEDGEVKSKGAVVKKLTDLDYDLPIINYCVKDYFVYGVSPEETISHNNRLIDYQKIFHVSSLYNRALKDCTFGKESVINPATGRKNSKVVWKGDGLVLDRERTFRVFASKLEADGALYKQKLGKNPEKFASCPEHCFIENGDITGKTCDEYVDRLDKNWYVNEAWRRIEQFCGHTLERQS